MSKLYNLTKPEKAMIKKQIVKFVAFRLMVAVVFLFALVFTISFVSSLDSYGSKQVDKLFTFCQVCQDATYITLSSIETPNSTSQINANMSVQGVGQFCYNYTPNQIGRYDFRGISDGCENSFATYVDVTSTGDTFGESQTGIIIAEGLVIAMLIGIGFSFSQEKWKLRGFFFTLALFVGVILLNSIRVIAGTSGTLNTMSNTAFIVGIVAVCFMALYLLIFYTIELFKQIKSKDKLKWEVSSRFN